MFNLKDRSLFELELFHFVLYIHSGFYILKCELNLHEEKLF